MAELGAYLTEKGIKRALLNVPVNRESRNQVALRIGKNWESLATCIGIPSQEVFDLKETYPNNPQDQRLGMMNRWEELYGSEATYLKLIEGLEQTGRRDLTEFLIQGVIMNRPPFGKAKSDEDGRQMAPSKLNMDGVPPSIHNKPGYLPLREPSRYDELGMGVWGPQSEPVKKQVNSPESLFWTSPPGNTKGPENVAVMRKAVITPERTSTEAVGHNDLKMFRNLYSGTQLTLSPSTYGNPFSTKTSTVSTSGSHYFIPQPNQPSKSRNIDALVDKFANFNLPHSEENFNSKESKELTRRGRGRFSLPSAKGDIGNLGGGTSIPTDPNSAGAVARTQSEPQHFNEHTSGRGCWTRESVKSSLPHESSVGLRLDEVPDMNSTSPDSGIEFSTTAPTPLEPIVPPLSNPQTSLSQGEDSKNGITESQDAVGSDYLSYACGHLRRPSLHSSSSIDSSGSPFPSPEINPVQVSEKSPGEYHPLASDGKRPIRQRCRKCAKLKQESKMLKEKLDKVRSEWNAEREQNTEQIRGLREELHRQRLDNYELKQRVFGSEVRHREATKTIQRLQMELQNMTQLFKRQLTEQARLKEAYDSCFTAKCALLNVQLQRADSMQCPEETYYDYGNQAAGMSYHGQYSMNTGPNDYASGYHEQTMTNTEWQTPNSMQSVHPSHYTHPHAM